MQFVKIRLRAHSGKKYLLNHSCELVEPVLTESTIAWLGFVLIYSDNDGNVTVKEIFANKNINMVTLANK